MKNDDIYISDFNYKLAGEKIKSYRKLAKMSQAALAEATHISVSHLSKIENGHYKSHFHNFVEIADALNISLYDLIGHQNLQTDHLFVESIANKAVNCNVRQKQLILEFMDLMLRLEKETPPYEQTIKK